MRAKLSSLLICSVVSLFAVTACTTPTKTNTNKNTQQPSTDKDGKNDVDDALQCSADEKSCNDQCVDVETDIDNCGKCGTKCKTSEVCDDGKCAVSCGGGASVCGSKCVDLRNDPKHCGECDEVCATGEFCSSGKCGVVCGPGTTKCNNKCVDTQTDEANCGTCGTACAAGELCGAGDCGTTGCGPGLTDCNGSCVNTQTSAANCGVCGTACNLGDICVNGGCQTCDSNTTDCDGDGWTVADGDCCDKPGACGSEPAKVNPGAIEVVGNGADDNCNGNTDLFDTQDTQACDGALSSNSQTAADYAKALGICRTTVESPATKQEKTWGLISAQLLRADGSAIVGNTQQVSIRPKFGTGIVPLDGQSLVVLSSGIASDATQQNPGPNITASAENVSGEFSDSVGISSGSSPSIQDWFNTANGTLKAAGALPSSVGCSSGSTDDEANDSVMLVLKLRAPTNAKAFSFNSYFFSSEYPEYVCSDYNDQYIALVDTVTPTTPVANPVDKNLMTYSANNEKWPIGINVAAGTSLFAVCKPQAEAGTCWSSAVDTASCSLGATSLAGTGFERPDTNSCQIGGATYWLTTAGNVNPGEIVTIRIAIWDVGDNAFDSTALLDGFQWLYDATRPGTN